MATKKEEKKSGFKEYFRGVRTELKKVVWLSPKQTLNNTVLVIVAVAVVSVFIGLLDLAFSTGLVALGKLI